jgi:uncharacterized cupin superfamily protein
MIIQPQDVPDRTGSNYPEAFKPRVAGRTKKRLGDAAGLNNFGVNLVRLEPGSQSALRHWHTKQDEFIYVLEGELTLVTDAGAQILTAGMAAGFPANQADGHHLINHADTTAIYLEVGDRTTDDTAHYPDDNLVAQSTPNGWQFSDRNGTPYP